MKPDVDLKNNYMINIKANPWVAQLEQEEPHFLHASVWNEQQNRFIRHMWDESARQYKPLAGPDPKLIEILPYTPISKDEAELLITYIIQEHHKGNKESVRAGFKDATDRTVVIGISNVTVPNYYDYLFSIREDKDEIAYGCETREQLLNNLTSGVYRPFNTFNKDAHGIIQMEPGVQDAPGAD